MFTLMCQGNLANCISNPVEPDSKLFFLFDTVHLIKSVRNNWFNKKTLGQVLCFPSPDNSSKISLAKLQDLKDIYETEKLNLIKKAPKLSQKVLYPTSFEKQNVLLALNIFHDSNSAALAQEAEEKGKDTMGTKKFIDQFLKWWNIVNVKNYEKGKRLKNPFCDPIKSSDQMSMVFLNKFYVWLVSWENKCGLPLKEERLPAKVSKENLDSYKQTSPSFCESLKSKCVGLFKMCLRHREVGSSEIGTCCRMRTEVWTIQNVDNGNVNAWSARSVDCGKIKWVEGDNFRYRYWVMSEVKTVEVIFEVKRIRIVTQSSKGNYSRNPNMVVILSVNASALRGPTNTSCCCQDLIMPNTPRPTSGLQSEALFVYMAIKGDPSCLAPGLSPLNHRCVLDIGMPTIYGHVTVT
ncbi:unnamed protein product [Larinioides sclopetarius]|uniref:Transposase n=1 Tax=Larinioides sclopetarius TaxID=280406 RepID=A0AAV1Z837_9ARAC